MLNNTSHAPQLRLNTFLATIKIILVNTTLPANIGSAARAMHTMGLSDLVVVNPKYPIDEAAIAHAAGATTVLKNCNIVPTLEQAVADCQWVLAASSRQRHMPQLVITPRQAVQLMLAQYSQFSLPQDAVLTQNQSDPQNGFKIALVFGREDRGLTNEELQLADYHMQIPANPAYGVLNVAAAVQVIASVFFEQASEFFMPDFVNHFSDLPQMNQATSPQVSLEQPVLNTTMSPETYPEITYFIRQLWDEAPINHAQKQQLQANFLLLLEQLELYSSDNPKLLPHRLARLAHRLQLDVKEYEMLQAALAKIQRRLKN